MRKLLLILSIILIAGALEMRAQCRNIRIPRGRISSTVKGLTKKEYICYRIQAKDGQKIILHLASADSRVKFSLREDSYDADFTAEDVRDWQGGIGNVDAYLISVGGGKMQTPFTLEVTVR